MIKPAAKGYRGWRVSRSVCSGKRGHNLGRWGAQATWRVHWARRLRWQQLGQYRNVTFGRLGRPQTWLARLQIRDDKVSPSHSEVCYEGQMNYLMLKKLKSIKGVFHYLIISRIRIGTRVIWFNPGATKTRSLSETFFPRFCWTLLHWRTLCGCCRQLRVSLDF